MAATRAARAPHRAHGHMYMRTPIDRQKHAACCAALHPRLSSTCAGRIISAATVDSHRRTCESVRMRESNRSVCPVEMAVGVWVVIETSGQGGFRVENIAPGAHRGPAGQQHCMRKLAQLQAPRHDGAVWNHRVGSSASKNHVASTEGQEYLLIVHGGQPPSLLLECCASSVRRKSSAGGGPVVEPPSDDLL